MMQVCTASEEHLCQVYKDMHSNRRAQDPKVESEAIRLTIRRKRPGLHIVSGCRNSVNVCSVKPRDTNGDRQSSRRGPWKQSLVKGKMGERVLEVLVMQLAEEKRRAEGPSEEERLRTVVADAVRSKAAVASWKPRRGEAHEPDGPVQQMHGHQCVHGLALHCWSCSPCTSQAGALQVVCGYGCFTVSCSRQVRFASIECAGK